MSIVIRRLPVSEQRLLLVQFTDKFGTGMFLGVVTLYLSTVGGLSAFQVGVVLSCFGLAGIAGGPTLGALGDTMDTARLLGALHLVRAAAFVAFAFSADLRLLVAEATVIGFCDRGAAATWQTLASRVEGERRATFRGYARLVGNVGLGAGSGAASLLLLATGGPVFRAALLIDSLSFAVCWALLRPLRSPGPSRRRTDGASYARVLRAPLADRRFRRFNVCELVLLLNNSLIKVGIPLWILHRTSAGEAVVPLVLVVNTATVFLLQLPVSRYAHTAARARRLLPVAGVAIVAGVGLLTAASGLSSGPAAVVVLAGTVLVTLAEVVESATAWELTLHLATPSTSSAYFGTYQVARGCEEAAGPSICAAAVAVGPLALAGIGVAALGAALAERAVVHDVGTGPREAPEIDVDPGAAETGRSLSTEAAS